MKPLSRLFIVLLLLTVFVAGLLYASRNATLPVLASSGVIADAERNILLFTVALSLLVVIPVYFMLALFAIQYRKGNKAATYKPEWAENKKLEALWWGIPIVIISVLAGVTYITSHSLDPYKAIGNEKPLEVQVVAMRWKWLFIYPEQNVATLNYLPIAIDQPVHFTVTADAPMSSFWIPALGSQVYAMNGMASQLNLQAHTEGTYTGYTTNINGEGYSDMTFKTKVTSKKQFDDWVKSAKASTDMLDKNEYDSLALPKSITNEKTYQLADASIFSSLTQGHSGHTSGGSKHSPNPHPEGAH